MKVTDRIIDDLEPIVEMYALGVPIDWDLTMAVMPTPEGMTMIGVQFFFFMKSPLLGTGDIGCIQFMPLEATKTRAHLEGMVKASIEQLNQQADQMRQLPPDPFRKVNGP